MEDYLKKKRKMLEKEERELKKSREQTKTYKGEWYTVNSIFGNDWAVFYALLGGREAGKSYSAMKWGVNRKLKKGKDFKFYWFRLTDSAADNLLASGADKLVDPDLKRKYGIKTMTKNHTVYTYKEREIETRNGNKRTEKYNVEEFCEILSCSTFYNTKGVGYFDNEFNGEYYIVLDEMNREKSERNSFDIVYNFVNLLENIVRSTKINIKVIMIGNTLDEASDILSAFNFIPDGFGRFKLKSKRCVIDYIKPSEAYLERRKGTLASILMPNASTFTNEVEIDRSLLVNKRLAVKPQFIIKFTKSKGDWFTVWNDNIVKDYNNEQCQVIAMTRYLDEVFNTDSQKNMFLMFDSRAFKFTNLATFKKMQKQFKLLKKI